MPKRQDGRPPVHREKVPESNSAAKNHVILISLYDYKFIMKNDKSGPLCRPEQERMEANGTGNGDPSGNHRRCGLPEL